MLQASERASVSLVRSAATGGRSWAGSSEKIPELLLFLGGRRCHVLIHRSGDRLWDVGIAQRGHEEPAPTISRQGQVESVPNPELTVRSSPVTIDQHFATLAGTLGLGPGLEHARDVEPYVEADHVGLPTLTAWDRPWTHGSGLPGCHFLVVA